MGYGYHLPSNENLFMLMLLVNTDDGIRLCWLKPKGFQANKLVFGLSYHGYAWILVNPKRECYWCTIIRDRFGLISMMWRRSELRFLMTSRRSCTVAMCFRSSIMIIGCFLGQLPLEIYMGSERGLSPTETNPLIINIPTFYVQGGGGRRGCKDELDYVIAALYNLRISSETPTRLKPNGSGDWASKKQVADGLKLISAQSTGGVKGFKPLVQDVSCW
ncbi:hypothetical protein CFP56_023099 [Quercus suber]|uniref:Uncharacterized protein n=1 Tax=Quercus suber TaxID=58331 RepID=A0AAW0KA27_QUESU